MRKGISLILLVITIIIIIILSGSIILTILPNNVISDSKATVQKGDFKTIADEFNLYKSNLYAKTDGKFDITTINADSTNIGTICKTAEKYKDIFRIVNGFLEYTGNNSTEKALAKEYSMIYYGTEKTGANIYINNTLEANIPSFTIYGKSNQSIPSGYTFYDYITITNNSTNGYLNSINTGIPFNTANKIEFKYKSTDMTSNILFLSGYASTTSRQAPYVACISSIYTNSFTTSTITPNGTSRGQLCDGTIKNFTLNYTSSNANNIAFGGWSDNVWSRTIDWYSFKIWNNETLLRNFIPAKRNSDNVIGMYDLVNNVFYTNASTGLFTTGTSVNLPTPDYPININNASNFNLISTNKYIQDQLAVHYDGIDNAGTGVHSNTLTNWVDLTGNNRNGSFTGLNSNNWESDGLKCNTTNNSISVPYYPSNLLTPFTISMYLKDISKTSMISQNMFFYSLIESNTLYPYLMNTSFTSIDLRAGSYTNLITIPNAVSAVDIDRTNLKFDFVYDGTKLYLYRNGVLLGNTNAITNLNSTKFTLMNYNTGGVRPFNAKLCNFKLYMKALSINEIKSNYELDKFRFENNNITNIKEQSSINIASTLRAIKVANNSTTYTYQDDAGNRYIADYIEMKNGKVNLVRNVAEYTYTGNENFNIPSIMTTYQRFYNNPSPLTSFGNTGSSWIMNNRLPINTVGNGEGVVCTGSNLINLIFSHARLGILTTDDSATRISKVKTYIQQQAALGNYYTSIYATSAPTTTDITNTADGQALLNLKTQKGYTNIYDTSGLNLWKKIVVKEK